VESKQMDRPRRFQPIADLASSNIFEQQQKLRHKQQRLVLLHQAAHCQHNDEAAGKCPVTPHCARMKRVWEHITHCKNQSCTVPHCLSSRSVLSHYRQCKDKRCLACGPVRAAIRRQRKIIAKAASQQQLSESSSGDVASHPVPVSSLEIKFQELSTDDDN